MGFTLDVLQKDPRVHAHGCCGLKVFSRAHPRWWHKEGGGAFAECVGHEGKGLLSETVILTKEAPESSLSLPQGEDRAGRGQL